MTEGAGGGVPRRHIKTRKIQTVTFILLFSGCNPCLKFCSPPHLHLKAGRGTRRSAVMARNGVKIRIFRDVRSLISKPQQRRGRAAPPAAPMIPSGVNSSSLRESTGTAADAATVVFAAGADSLSLPEITTGTSVGVLRTGSPMTPAERAGVNSIGRLSPSLAAGVDESLDAGPALTRSNPTACILVKVPSADSLKHEGSRLYKDEKGDWVADLVPESTAESDASSRTQLMGDRIDWPNPTMV